MTALGDIGPYDAVFCSHALEHLKPTDVMVALEEFRRVLHPGGAVFVFVPDLEDIKPTFEVLYESPSGPVSGHDMYYGHTIFSDSNPYMRHLTGFIAETLRGAFEQAGFSTVMVNRVGCFNLFGVAIK